MKLSHAIFGGTPNPRLLSQAFDAVCAQARTRRVRESSSGAFPYLIVSLIPSCPPPFRLRQSFDLREPLVTFQAAVDGKVHVVTYPAPARQHPRPG